MKLILIIFLVLLAIIKFYIKPKYIPKIKGSIGESKVDFILTQLNKKNYIVLNDLLFQNGKLTTQIDHVVICKSGIIVIETKNYKGWIHGYEKYKYWTQTLYKNKYKLRNPIRQNWVHVNVIKNILWQYKYIKYSPVVVFAGSAKLKNVYTTHPVIYNSQLIGLIKRLDVEENLSTNQMQLIKNILIKHNISDSKARRKHKELLRRHHRETHPDAQNKICPQCGHKLVIRNGKYGEFYGCETFPTCRYTTNIK